MNERIQQMIYSLNEKVGVHWTNEDKIKFAELLIRECIDQCEKQEYEYWRAPEDQEFTPQDCADAIARHFGVEK